MKRDKDTLSTIITWPTSRIMLATLMVLLIGAGFRLLFEIRWVIFVLFIAIVIGTALRPVADWLHQWGIPRMAGVGLAYLALLLLLGTFAILLVPPLVEQGTVIFAEVPAYYSQFRGTLLNSSNLLLQQLSWQLPPSLPTFESMPVTEVEVGEAVPPDTSRASLLFKGFVTFIAALMLSFSWVLEGRRATHTLLFLLPLKRRDGARDLINAVEAKVGAYVRGQTILCLIIGSMALVAYMLIGLPNALVLALFAGVMELIPVLGPVLGAVPAILLAATLGTDKVIWVIVASVVIQQLENSLILPRVMDKSVGVHPIVTLLALFSLGSVWGVLGAILAVPIAAILQLLLDRFVFEPASVGLETPTRRDELSLLRYEAQELVKDVRKQSRHKTITDEPAGDHLEEELEAIVVDLDSILARSKPAAVEVPE